MRAPGKTERHAGLPKGVRDFCILGLDAILLVFLSLQIIVAGCLLTYGSIPVPADWVAAFVDREDGAVRLEVDEVRLGLDGSVRVRQPRLFLPEHELPFIEAESAVLRLRFPAGRSGPARYLKALLVSGGTVHLPAIHSPSGQRLAALEKTAFKLSLDGERIRVESFAALHRTLRVRGAADWPYVADEAARRAATPEMMDRLFVLLARGMREADRIAPFASPTLTIDLSEQADRSLKGRIELSSRSLSHEKAEAENIRLRTGIHLIDRKLAAADPVRVTARRLAFPEYGLEIDGLTASVDGTVWSGAGAIADVRLSAGALRRDGLALAAPVVHLVPTDGDRLRFSGSAGALDGAFRFSGEADLSARTALIEAGGILDPRPLIPGAVRQRLPGLDWTRPPYARVDLRLAEGFAFTDSRFALRLGPVEAAGIRFDSIQANGRYADGLIDFDAVQMDRGRQWLDAGFRFDTKTKDYAVTLRGSAIPYDYNALLPRWWATIFKDIRFDGPNSAEGDFIIHGKAGSRTVRLFYGSAEGGAVRYRGVPIESGQLKVRGRGRYVELFDLAATAAGGGSLAGRFSWTSLDDGIRSPLSTRYELESQLPLPAAIKLVPETIASIINRFEPENTPEIRLRGAYFHAAYPAFSRFSSFHLEADAQGPVQIRGIPLDQLAFRLEGREQGSFLRDLRFGYAGGDGSGAADIRPVADGAPTVRFTLALNDADRHAAVRGLETLEAENDPARPQPADELQAARPNRLDLELQAEGPADDFLAYRGFGRFEVEDPSLGALQLLGPLSRILQDTPLGFTTFNLHTAYGRFEIDRSRLTFPDIRVDGAKTRITAKGTVSLPERELDMRVLVRLFGNLGAPEGTLQQIGKVFSPLANFLSFQLTGTIDKPQWRSLYDPRNFIPGL